MKKKILKFLIIAVLLLMVVPGKSLDAAFYPDARVEKNGYNAFGQQLNFTLHASGYSGAGPGRVVSTWTTSWSTWPHFVRDERSWTVGFPGGEYAYGSFRFVLEVPIPWGGAIGLKQSTHYVSILF